jgi:hypothetical protein
MRQKLPNNAAPLPTNRTASGVEPIKTTTDEGRMKTRIEQLRIKLVKMSALARAVADLASELEPDATAEHVQALAFLAQDSANDALDEIFSLVSSY